MTLILLDSFWVKAKAYVESLGHTEQDDPSRFEHLVRAAYADERRRGHIMLKRSGIGMAILKSAIGMEPRKRFEVKKKITKDKGKTGKPEVGGWAQGKRPDYKGAVHGQIMAVGRDGVVIRDDRGRRHRVRSEHVMDFAAPLAEKEWPKAAKALADSGQKVDPVSRFKKPEKRDRPDKKLKRRINTLGKKHKDLDVKRALKEGSVEDIQKLVEHYKDRPVPKKLKKSLEELAALEHEQWMQWTQTIAERGEVSEDQIAKWKKNWVPYDQLTDDVKEHDRVWARKVMAIKKSSEVWRV